MTRATPLVREALLAALTAGACAAALAWLGPPGSDLAAHAYQRAVFLQHGFDLWNNFWYAGRYSFVTYSLLYYPLAALLGIKLLAVATIAMASLAFAVVIGREWGPTARWSSRTFAVVWAGIVLSAAFPFALGVALALLAIWTLQDQRNGRFAVLALLTLAASPVAFVLLVLLLAGIAVGRRARGRRLLVPGLTLVAAAGLEAVLWRLFPGGGRYPFSLAELVPALVFSSIGVVVTWRIERARALAPIFVVYGVACLAAFVVPSAVGENIARLRFVAIPIAVLTLSLRDWRPRWYVVVVLALAVSWNVSPLAASFVKGRADTTANAAYWRPAIGFLRAHLGPDYRVEAVDTVGHWPAVYLPRAGIPLARGWFRQDDFPQNSVLYSKLGATAYGSWLRGLGVRYVVLTDAPPDYSAAGEAALLRSGHSGLVPVFVTGRVTIFEVPHAQPLVTGPGVPRVLSLAESHLRLALDGGGRYRIAVRWSPYWQATTGCLSEGRDGMMRLATKRGGTVTVSFDVEAAGALRALAGTTSSCRP